jgi:hypothetical protein
MRHVYAADIQAKEAAVVAQGALGLLHADAREFMLHLDLDVIAQEEFPATNVPDSGGLSFADVQASLIEFVKHKNLLALDVAQYNPDRDPDGSGASRLIELLAEVLAARLAALGPVAPAPAATPAPTSAEPEPSSLGADSGSTPATEPEASTTEPSAAESPSRGASPAESSTPETSSTT